MNEQKRESQIVSSKKANDAGWTVAVCMLLAFVVYVIAVSR